MNRYRNFLILSLLGLIFLSFFGYLVWKKFVVTPSATNNEEIEGGGGSLIFPSGSGPDNVQPSTTTGPITGGQPTDKKIPQFFKISNVPVLGAGFSHKDNKTYFQFLEKKTGHIYEYDPSIQSIARVTNTTIPDIYTALWHGSSTLIQYTNTSGEKESFIVSNNFDIENSSLSGKFIRKNITSVSAVPHTDNFLLKTDTLAGTQLSFISPVTLDEREVMRFPLTEIIPQIRNSKMFLTTSPSYQVDGFFYEVIGGGNLKRILGPFKGLVTLVSPSGESAILSRHNENLSFVNLGTKKTIQTLPLKTIVDKCIWMNDEEVLCAVPKNVPSNVRLPDAWYNRSYISSDIIWKINISNQESKIVTIPETFGSSIDISEIGISEDGKYFYVINRITNELWGGLLN